MIPTFLSPLANHLWQSTLTAGVAGLLTVALHRNHARVRHAVWLAASCKFLLPFSLLIALGGHTRWRTVVPQTKPSSLSVMLEQVSRPFETSAVASPVELAKPVAASPLPAVLLGIWVCGFLGLACSWGIRWWRIRAAVRAGSRLRLEIPIRAVSVPTLLEPGVFGVFQPVLLFPDGIFDRLTPAQLKAIIAHELCHVRHRDNLIAVIHMFVETVFWFHPLVWWIGKRMVEERELACDQEVLRTMSDPKIYAEGILNVCKFYLAPPEACISGVAGSDLRKRIESIMANRITYSLTLGRKLMLAVVTTAAVVVPIIVGIDNVSLGRAQSQAASQGAPQEAPQAAAFDVASVRPAAIWKAGGEGSKRSRIEYSPTSLSMWNVDLTDCVQWAYRVKFYQVSGPGFPNSERYDILAKTENSVPVSQLRLMLQDLLGKRFQLALHRETKMLPVFELVVAKGGPRLPAQKADLSPTHAFESLPRVRDGSFIFQDVSLTDFAAGLSLLRGIDLPVVDRTGIKGVFDITLKSAADAILQPDGPSPVTLVQEQLGLKLVTAKAPVEVLVIDSVGKPSEN